MTSRIAVSAKGTLRALSPARAGDREDPLNPRLSIGRLAGEDFDVGQRVELGAAVGVATEDGHLVLGVDAHHLEQHRPNGGAGVEGERLLIVLASAVVAHFGEGRDMGEDEDPPRSRQGRDDELAKGRRGLVAEAIQLGEELAAVQLAEVVSQRVVGELERGLEASSEASIPEAAMSNQRRLGAELDDARVG